MKSFFAAALFLTALQPAFAKEAIKTIPMLVTEKGFEPAEIKVKPGTHVVLKITRKTDATCATQIFIAEKKIKQDLPMNKEVTVDVGTLKKGDVRFACGMDMITGHIIIE